MALTQEQVERLTQVIGQTKDNELDCDEFLPHLAEWSERVQNGESIDNAAELVRGHLSICPECLEEFRILAEVLSSQ
jgi:hypothetical protein